MSMRYSAVRLARDGSTTVQVGRAGFHVMRVRRNIRMSSQSKRHPGRVLPLLPTMIALLFTFATPAAAQDGPAPKVELYGGYSFFQPASDIHGQLPGSLLPLSSRLESAPR